METAQDLIEVLNLITDKNKKLVFTIDSTKYHGVSNLDFQEITIGADVELYFTMKV